MFTDAPQLNDVSDPIWNIALHFVAVLAIIGLALWFFTCFYPGKKDDDD